MQRPNLKRLTPEAIAYSGRRWTLVRQVRELLSDDDPRDPDEMTNEELQVVIDDANASSSEGE